MPTDIALETLHRWLALLLADPAQAAWREVLREENQQAAMDAGDLLREEFAGREMTLGFGELPAERLDVRSVVAALHDRAVDPAAEYQRTFGFIMCRECPPYETEYHLNEDTFFRAQQMADVAGFYRAFGLHVRDDLRERPDHAALELEFLALLLFKHRTALAQSDDDAAEQHAAICRDARVAFVRDHVSWWLPSFAVALRKKSPTGLYAAVANLLAAVLPLERTQVNVPSPPAPCEPRSADTANECQGCLALTNA